MKTKRIEKLLRRATRHREQAAGARPRNQLPNGRAWRPETHRQHAERLEIEAARLLVEGLQYMSREAPTKKSNAYQNRKRAERLGCNPGRGYTVYQGRVMTNYEKQVLQGKAFPGQSVGNRKPPKKAKN